MGNERQRQPGHRHDPQRHPVVLELLRRYSRHQDVTVRLQRVYARASQAHREPGQGAPVQAREPHAVSRRLGSSTVAALITAYEAGATTAQLAEQYGVSRTAVKDLLHAHRTAVRRPVGLLDEDVNEAARLYEVGWLLRKIAVKFNVSQENVRRQLLSRGVVMRSGHGDHRRDQR